MTQTAQVAAELRIPYLIAVCGTKGVGKSYTTVEYLRQYVKGNPSKGVPGRKVLIFDVNNEYSDKLKFPDIKALGMEHLPLYANQEMPEIRRIAPIWPTGQKMSLDDMARVLLWIVTVFKDGLLVIEDINLYVQDNMPGDLIGTICTNRHRNLDIIVHYQSIGRLSPKVWQNVNWIRWHKINDSIKRHENKIPDKFECLSLCERLVNEKFKEDKHYYLWVDTGMMKIHPDVSKDEIKKCVEEHVEDNYSRLVSPLLNRVGRDGKKKYNAQQAYDSEVNRLLDTYFEEAA